jgi:hypothetical protein
MADRKPMQPRKPRAARPGTMSVSAHPRATDSIRRARGWGGIAGLLLVGWLSLRAGVVPFEAGLRALLGGVAGYVAAWLVAVQVWRHLVVAEVRAAAGGVRRRAGGNQG